MATSKFDCISNKPILVLNPPSCQRSSFDRIFNKPILVPKPLRCQCRSPIKSSNTGQVRPLDSSYPVDLTVLEKNFLFKHEVNVKFPPKVNNTTTHKAVK